MKLELWIVVSHYVGAGPLQKQPVSAEPFLQPSTPSCVCVYVSV